MPHSPNQFWRIVTRRKFAAAVLISILTGATFAVIHRLPVGFSPLALPSSFSNRTLAGPAPVAPGSIAFAGAPYSTPEGNNTDHDVTITVSRSGGSDGAVSVHWATSAGTATAGTDYVEASGDVSWADADAADKTFLVTVKGDLDYEANETVNITLSSPTGGATLSGPNPTTLTIINDDGPTANATLTVNTTDDLDNGACLVSHCSLREAINSANFDSNANTIDFNIPGSDPGCNGGLGPCTITLGGSELAITHDVTIDNSSSGERVIVDASQNSRVFNISSGATVTISTLTMTNGITALGQDGGGIANNGVLTVLNSTVTKNTSNHGGAGISNNGTLTVIGSTISNNSTTQGGGGGIRNPGVLTIINSTISGNSSLQNGGGINNDKGTATITNATITNNHSRNAGGGICIKCGDFSSGPVVLQNTIVAANTDDAANYDVRGQVDSTSFNNLIGNGDQLTGIDNDSQGNQIGTIESTIDPKLGPLASNGGPTQTHALLFLSPAIDAGNDCVTDLSCSSNNPSSPITTDQRGVIRPHGTHVDVGAFEFTIVVNTTDDHDDGSCDSNDCSLREAINAANLAVTNGATAAVIAFNIPAADSGHVYYADDHLSGQVSLNAVTQTSEADDAALVTHHLIDPDYQHSWWTIRVNANADNPLPPLPELSGNVFIDGYTQPGSSPNTKLVSSGINAILRIEIDGSRDADGTGLEACGTGGSTVQGLAINRYLIQQLWLISDGNTIQGNFIGTDVSGTLGFEAGGDGIFFDDASFNDIGGGDASQRNLISGNHNGIFLRTSSFTFDRAPRDVTQKARPARADSTRSNSAARPQKSNSVATPGQKNSPVAAATKSNGSKTPRAKAPISADFLFGSAFNNIEGNYIGTDRSGLHALANQVGIYLIGSSDNMIGCTVPEEANVISGNLDDGVLITDSMSTANLVQGNFIGTDCTGGGSNTPSNHIGNGGAGISIYDGVQNIIGLDLSDDGRANTIANNTGPGVDVEIGVNPGTGNVIRGNSIHDNGGLGIDLGNDGVTANDGGDGDPGPNNLQNFPNQFTASESGGVVAISGQLDSTDGHTFRIDFYGNSACDGSGNGEGQTYLGSVSQDVTINGAPANFDFSYSTATYPGVQVVTATATDLGTGDTSEFSKCVPVSGTGDIQFTSAAYTVNEGAGTAAITVSRVGGSIGAITADFSTSDGSAHAPGDYTAFTNFKISYADGETGVKSINIPIVDDSTYEGDETVNLSLSVTTVHAAAQRDSEAPPIVDPKAAVLTIIDNDGVAFTIDDVTQNEGNSGPTTFTFHITKTGTTDLTLPLIVNTADGTAQAPGDYLAIVDQTVTFAPLDTSKTVDVTVNGDTNPEPNETFFVNLSSRRDVTFSRSQGVGTITNDDPCPTTFIVNSVGDAGDSTPGDGVCATGGAVCTLRAAIEEANALNVCGAININFNFGSATITLGSQITIDHNVNINGPSANSIAIGGNNLTRLFTLNSGRTASINSLTLTGGNGSGGDGGAIQNNGTLTLNLVTLSGNRAVNGGAIRSDSALALTNTTISGNLANGDGGGLYSAIGQATLTNVTVAYNRANNDNAGGGSGGGVFVASGNVLLHNTIVTDNYQGPSPSNSADNIGGTVDSSSSYNLVGNPAGGLTNGTNHNQVGVFTGLLGALMNNGGPTFTHGLLYNSPALDAGDGLVVNSPLFVTVDQRGLSRPADGDNNGSSGVDIGAYERQVTETRPVANGANVGVDINDVRLTFPCVPAFGCSALAAKPEAAVNPEVSANSVDLKVVAVPGDAPAGSGPAFDVTPSSAFYAPPVTVCFYLPSITNSAVFATLKIFHRENNAGCPTSAPCLVDKNATPNFANKTVCASVDSFSQFVINQNVSPTATNATVSGQILDNDGTPVEGAAVRMSGTQNRLAITDTQGNYHFDDVETNGLYVLTPLRSNFTFSPAQRTINQLGTHTEATFTAAANGGGLNPLDTTEYFVRQQYLDFLGREPDEAGFNFWVNNIDSCGADSGCREAKRIDTSAAFFLSIEFQQTGYLVYRTYESAYGNLLNAPVPIALREFKPDTQEIGIGVVVLQSGWPQRLENNKRAFMNEFVQRPRFTSAYPTTMTPGQFVDQLFANAHVPSTDPDYAAALAEFGAVTDTSDIAARARVLRSVAENLSLTRQQFNQAFVLMEYFGYLQRDPNSGRDTDFTGYDFWLEKLNHFNGNFENAEMVKAFVSSAEYRGRFPR